MGLIKYSKHLLVFREVLLVWIVYMWVGNAKNLASGIAIYAAATHSNSVFFVYFPNDAV